MASQTVTVLKIAGAGGRYVNDQFIRFKSQQKQSRSPDALIASDHWTPCCRRDMAAFAEHLRAHGRALPTVFFAEYVDTWSAPASPQWILPVWRKDAIQLFGDEYILECYRLPDRGRLQRDLKQALRRKGIRERNPQENRWAVVLLQEALSAWDPLVEEGSLVWLRRACAASVLDEELKESIEKVPAWLLE